jgi:hypothetical protein|tara:strand:+ start:254 stop:700 length:447 start_codon:yes stop_codon:yes gene_type:complete
MQTVGLMYIASTAGNLIVSSTLKPIVSSTISLIGSLTTSSISHESLDVVIVEIDVAATIKTIEATILTINSHKEPLKTASTTVINAIQNINDTLTKIADVTASHASGYISRWRILNLDTEIAELRSGMTILNKRFALLCNINTMNNNT